MDVRLPNGTVVRGVPEGTTKTQLVAKLKSSGHDISWAEPGFRQQPPSILEALKEGADVGRGLSENILGAAYNRLLGSKRVDPLESTRQGRVVYEQPMVSPEEEFTTPRTTGEALAQFAGRAAREAMDPIGVMLPFSTLGRAVAGGIGFGAATPVAKRIAQGQDIKPSEAAQGAAAGAIGSALGYSIPAAVRSLRKPQAQIPAPLPSSIGAAQVKGTAPGVLGTKETLGERLATSASRMAKAASPFFGGRSIRQLDEKAKLSPTLDAFRNQIEHRAEYELPEGQVALPDFTENVLERIGHFRGRLAQAIDPLRTTLGGLSAKNRARLAVDIRAGAQTQAATQIRSLLDDVRQYAKDSGLELGYTENYFPRVYNVAALRKEGGAAAFQKVLSKHGLDATSADDVWRQLTSEDGIPMGFIESSIPGRPSWTRSRELAHIPDEELAPFLYSDPRSVLDKYVQHVVRRAEHAKIFGPNGEKLQAAMPQIREELLQAGSRLNAADEKMLNGISQALIGQYKPITSPSLQKFHRMNASYQFMRTLPMSVMSSLAEPLLTLGAGPVAFAKGIGTGIGYAARQASRKFNFHIGKDLSRQELEELGLIVDVSLADTLKESVGRTGHVLGEAADVSAFPQGRATNIFFKANLMEPWANFTRSVALGAGQKSIASTIKRLGGKKNSQMVARLKQLGVDPLEAKGWLERTGGQFNVADPYQDRMRKSLIRFVNDYVMLPRVATRPLWMSDPHYAFIGQLKSYGNTFGNTVGRRWLHQMVNVGREPKQAALTVGTIGTMLYANTFVNRGREWLSYGDKGDPKFKDESAASEVFRAWDRSGFNGGFQPVIDSIWGHRYGKPGLIQPLGPTAGQAYGLSEGIFDVLRRGKTTKIKGELLYSVPGFGQLPTETKREYREALQE